MKTIVALALLAVVAAAAHAVERPGSTQSRPTAPGSAIHNAMPGAQQLARPPLEQVRQPRIESLGGATVRQYYIMDGLQIRLAGLGAPGQVQVSVHPFTAFPTGSPPPGPGGPPLTGCFFNGSTTVVPAVIDPDGTATATFTGFWFPGQRASVTRDGYCRIEVRIRRMQPNTSYREEARIVSNVVRIAAHEGVSVTDTARMRTFLKPVASPKCTADDGAGKFGIRITAGATPQACRTDFLRRTEGASRDAPPSGNALGRGIILAGMVWKLEGDANRCELCRNPLSPCRGVTPQATFAESIGAEVVQWVYAPVVPGEIGNGYRFAVFTGPPALDSGALIRVDTRDYDYDTSHLDYLDRLFSVAVGNPPAHAAAVIGQADMNWRSWMRPFGIGLACSAWTPPRPSEATKNIRGAIGQIAQGQAPTLPPAPYLRLVLDELYVLRPVGQRLPWE